MELEDLLDITCQQYYKRGIANIHKIPTYFKITGTTRDIILNFLALADYYLKGGLLDGYYSYPTRYRAVPP